MQSSVDFRRLQSSVNQTARVTIHCPERREVTAKLIRLPNSFQELLNVGSHKFEFPATKVFTSEGAVVDDIEVIRDGDHLILASDRT